MRLHFFELVWFSTYAELRAERARLRRHDAPHRFTVCVKRDHCQRRMHECAETDAAGPLIVTWQFDY